MSRIFISYRRADSAGHAGRLSDKLNLSFGQNLTFYDFEDIKPGTDFLHQIRAAISECKVMLVLIGPYWLKDVTDRQRLDDPRDVLRLEVTDALKRDITVIPVLLGGAKMPSAEDLPDPLKTLSRRQAVEITDSRWAYDVEQLIERLRELIMPVMPGERQIPLAQARQKLNQNQLDYFKLLANKPAEALELAQKGLAFLDQVSPIYPGDLYLQSVRGYLHKNRAMALRKLHRYEEFEKALVEANRVFDTLARESAGVWNGKGSVEALRGNFKEALHFIDLALSIDPDYEAAKRDRETIVQLLQQKN
jgi:tetratricopeptide (TPR) repeat protein